MEKLSKAHCEACDISAKTVSKDEINTLMPQVPGWEIIDDAGIHKLSQTFTTKKYTKSMSFTNDVAKLAESINHHPLMVVEYGSVTVVWWSHEIKGLHKNDFIMAAKTSELF